MVTSMRKVYFYFIEKKSGGSISRLEWSSVYYTESRLLSFLRLIYGSSTGHQSQIIHWNGRKDGQECHLSIINICLSSGKLCPLFSFD
jgi:hypothetical protein